jgi:uncharacterized protein (UPF0218 family)
MLCVKLLFSKNQLKLLNISTSLLYGRPEEPLRIFFLRVDAFLRQTIRKLLGKELWKQNIFIKNK